MILNLITVEPCINQLKVLLQLNLITLVILNTGMFNTYIEGHNALIYHFFDERKTCLTMLHAVAAYYRGAMGILLVYDVTDEASFNSNLLSLVLLEV